MAGSSKQTTDHDEIRRWAEERGGKPTAVRDTKGDGEGIGVLRIDFPGYSGEDRLEEISWDEFFDTFEKKKLAFLYQDETAKGEESRFFKLVNR
jgi:anaerobic selenocysteine-containing dehydrogenase